MSTEPIWRTESTSAGNTLEIAAAVGSKLRGAEVIELVSDLGGGKTTFVKGLAKGMGSLDEVRSPSFTLSNEYFAGALRLYHFDFYRLSEPGIMRQELAEAVADLSAVVVVEWPEIVEDVLPPARLVIRIKVTGENSRRLEFNWPPALAYLLPVPTSA
jgi:tRNA threonylcarbamoyladenosine biosynthesis protein TsaE